MLLRLQTFKIFPLDFNLSDFSCAVDCEYQEVVTGCPADCDPIRRTTQCPDHCVRAKYTRSYNITQEPRHGGTACPSEVRDGVHTEQPCCGK